MSKATPARSRHADDLYTTLQVLGKGAFGVCRLVRCKETGELFAMKLLERGSQQITMERELLNLASLQHPNVIGFREVVLTPDSLGIVMEYAAGGDLFSLLVKHQRFVEQEARYFYQQLIIGLECVHNVGVCHRDLKLENMLLDGSPAPLLKICDFGYSKSIVLDSAPKSTVGTPAYIAPEVLARTPYDGQIADIWSAGVALYVMLVGRYPFEDSADPHNHRKTMRNIMIGHYTIPHHVDVSRDCTDLLAGMLQRDPAQRIRLAQIKQHPWFRRNAHNEVINGYPNASLWTSRGQTPEEIQAVIREAQEPLPQHNILPQLEAYVEDALMHDDDDYDVPPMPHHTRPLSDALASC